MTRKPVSEKKLATPMGETTTGRQGKKYRSFSNGEKNATPNPPLVKASSIPCDNVDKNRNVNVIRETPPT